MLGLSAFRDLGPGPCISSLKLFRNHPWMSSPSELSLHRARDAQSPVEGPPRAGDCPQCLADADSFTPHDSAVTRVIITPVFQMGTPALASLNHTHSLAETGPGVRFQSLPSSPLAAMVLAACPASSGPRALTRDTCLPPSRHGLPVPRPARFGARVSSRAFA